MSRLRAAVLGATGPVGQRFVQRLAHHPCFELAAVAARDARAGRPYRDTAWHLEGDAPEAVQALELSTVDRVASSDDVDVAFSALPAGTAGAVETRLATAGIPVFTNARDHRATANVPLLIPEVNPDHLGLVERQGAPGFIVANGNCSAIILTLALAPLHRAFGLDEVHVTTLQGLSGAGYPGVSALDAVDNVLVRIPGEEEKLESEPLRTLGTPEEPAPFRIHATCTRVPVREGHLEAVHLRLREGADAEAVKEALGAFRGPPEVQGLHGAPEAPIRVTGDPDRPQPRRDRDAGGGMAVTVGRVRVSGDGHGVRMVVLGHNTVRGAAGQSVLNAEYAHAVGRLKRRA